MKNMHIFIPKQAFLLLIFLCFATPVLASLPTTHYVDFGGAHGFTYFPNALTFETGDTIIFRGDFTTYPIVSTSVPVGAEPIGPVISGTTYKYIVLVPGTYSYQNNTYAVIGMKGSFTSILLPHGSQTNEGREFYLGMLYPSYNTISLPLQGTLKCYALITSYNDNVVTVSYYDESGKEIPGAPANIMAKHTLQVPLDINAMRIDKTPETPVYKACHITAKNPVTVEYLSYGVNSGGSYLALPVMGLGKNYVVASYNDNPGNGALYSELYGGYYYPKTFENAGGEFLIIASEDGTSVKITPNTTTTGGKTGAHTGTGANGTARPFSISLSKGQCYFVKSNGKDASQDMSGSLIEATKPVAVIAGNEDAFLGGIDPYYLEGRDFMIEQMVPVEYWDSAGYYSVPLTESIPPGNEGHGDNYRVYTFDPNGAKINAEVIGIGGSYPMNTSRLASPPPEILDINGPVDIYSTNGRKFSVMQYDERSQPLKSPWPTPSMMTVIPHSRWRNSCTFSVFSNASGELGGGSAANQFMTVIADSLADIQVSVDGAKEKSLGSAFSTAGNFTVVSNHSSVKAARYRIGPGAYYLHSSQPFMVYRYGMKEIDITGISPGANSYWDFEFEYASPAGMQLNTGAVPSFKVSVAEPSPCSGWKVCITDTGTSDPGIKAVIIVNDTAGIYYDKVGLHSLNISLDSSLGDYVDGELHPHWHSAGGYCFDVLITNPLIEASASLALIDNNGNSRLLNLHRDPSSLFFNTSPVRSLRPDSIYIPPQKIGTKLCTTFVFKNTGKAKSIPVSFVSARFSHEDPAYSIGAITPPIPCVINPNDSLTLEICYAAKDSLRHRDSLIVSSDCIFELVAFDARSVTGLIEASNTDFGPIIEGTDACKSITISNSGSASFALKKSFAISDTVNFSLDPQSIALLPAVMLPSKGLGMKICYHPKEPTDSVRYDTARIDWNTDLEPEFAATHKSYSVVTGSVYKKPQESVSGIAINKTLEVHPNPVSGNSVMVTFSPVEIRSVLSIFDILGREVYRKELSSGVANLEIPLQNFPKGIYYVRLNSNYGVQSEKLEID
jgi:hypothetical protein